MGVVLLILKIIGLFLLGALLLLFIAMLIPVTVTADYRDRALTVSVRVLGFKKLLYPANKKEKKPRKPAEAEKTETVSDEKRKKLDIEVLKSLFNPARSSVRYVLKRIKVKNLFISIVANGDEPDEIGVTAGRWWAVLGSVRAALAQYRNIEIERFEAVPNFLNKDISNRFSATIWARPITMGGAGIEFLRLWLKNRITSKRNVKNNKKVA